MPYERTQEAAWAAIVLPWSKHPRVAKAMPAAPEGGPQGLVEAIERFRAA